MAPIGGVASTSNVAIRNIAGLALVEAGDSTAVARGLTVKSPQATTLNILNIGID